MGEFIGLYLALAGALCFVQGQNFKISTKYTNAKLVFIWSNISTLPNDIIITKDSQSNGWMTTDNDQYTVGDVTKYKSVSIKVREYNSSDLSVYVDYNKTHNVSTVQSTEGESKNISWTAEYFPLSGRFFIFHAYNSSVSTIIQIANTVPPPTEKYVYHTRPFNSVNILFEVKNITVEDAGYYVGGATEEGAWSGERGVILIVSGKPVKPIIRGDLNVKIRNYIYLKCESRSTSAPYYYKKFPPLSYSWFINNTRLDGEDRETYSFIVSKKSKCNRYSCQAKETLQSERSKEIQINPLYGPQSVMIIPQPPNNGLNIPSWDFFPSYNCSADCNPPCTLQWKYYHPFRGLSNVTSLGYSSITLPKLRADRSKITSIRCVVNGIEGRRILNISLNGLHLSYPKVYINVKRQNTVTVNEGIPLFLSCFVQGNPNPEVTLRKFSSNQILGQSVKNWLNYTLTREAQCSDTGTYSCEGKSTGFRRIFKDPFHINVLCYPRLDESQLFKTNYYGSRSGPDAKIIVSLPVVANPLPFTSSILWVGPTMDFTWAKVSQRDNIIYKHWINSTIPIHDQRSFGNYSLIYDGRIIINITINAKGKPQPPLNFSGYSYTSGYINFTWLSNFNGGLEQFFILSQRKGSRWIEVTNLTDPGEGNMGYHELGPLTPGQKYWYRLESCTVISCSLRPVEIKVTLQGVS